MNANFKVIGLIRLGIKSKSTAPEADALTTRPSERCASSSSDGSTLMLFFGWQHSAGLIHVLAFFHLSAKEKQVLSKYLRV